MSSSHYSVAVFAYNEEQSIQACIESIKRNSDDRLQHIKVLANGCSDRTIEKAQDLSRNHKEIEVIDIKIGDKCNAWNTYVYEHADSKIPVHFFTDGDVTFSGNIFSRLSKDLICNQEANAAAGVPLTGRNREQYLKLIEERHCLFGGCHALKTDFLEKVRRTNFRLPRGLMWIDSAITKIVNSDLGNPRHGREDRIIHNKNCGYTFDSISPLSWTDVKLYLSRITRYEAGQLQERHLERIPFSDWPADLMSINSQIIKSIRSGDTKTRLGLKRSILRKLSRDQKRLQQSS